MAASKSQVNPVTVFPTSTGRVAGEDACVCWPPLRVPGTWWVRDPDRFPEL